MSEANCWDLTLLARAAAAAAAAAVGIILLRPKPANVHGKLRAGQFLIPNEDRSVAFFKIPFRKIFSATTYQVSL